MHLGKKRCFAVMVIEIFKLTEALDSAEFRSKLEWEKYQLYFSISL